MTTLRAITSSELVKLRADNQWSSLYAAIYKPQTIFAAQINQSFTTTDDITEITFDNVTTGAYTDIPAGATMYIGTTPGAYNVGLARVRKAATSSVIYIGRISEIVWADNLYITVVREFSLWAKHWLVKSENEVYMDVDIAYSDQNTLFDPVPVLGPDWVVLLVDGSVTINPSAAGSWVFDSTISSYSWAAPGSYSVTGGSSSSCSITYTSAGQYLIQCQVTAANGKSFIGYRNVFVFESFDDAIEVNLDSCTGDMDSGGWNFTVTGYQGISVTDVREGAKVVLFTKDVFNGIVDNLGPQAGHENLLVVGWIDGETIEQNAELGSVKFTCRGPAGRLNTMTGFPTGLKQDTVSSLTWLLVRSLTVDKAIYNTLHWRSTLTAVADVTLTGDTRTASALTPPAGTLWSQVVYMANRLIALPAANRFGQMFVEIDAVVTPLASRSSFPIVMTITKSDWDNDQNLSIEYKPLAQTAIMNVSGTGDAEYEVFFARAPGLIFRRFGKQENRDQLLFSTQQECNDAAKFLLSKSNNKYPAIGIQLAQNNKFIDICPRSFVKLTVAAGDTPRGISFTNKNLLVRRMSFKHDYKTGALLTNLDTCEAETTGENEPEGQTVIPPTIAKQNSPDQPGLPTFTFSPFNSPYIPTVPIVVPVDPHIPGAIECPSNSIANGPFPFTLRGVLLNNTTESMFGGFASYTAQARGAGATNPTTLILNCELDEMGMGWVENPSATWMHVYLCDQLGNRIIEGSITGSGKQRIVTFIPPANTRFWSVEIAMDSFNTITASALTEGWDNYGGPFIGGTVLIQHSWWGATYGYIWVKAEEKVRWNDWHIYDYSHIGINHILTIDNGDYSLDLEARIHKIQNSNGTHVLALGGASCYGVYCTQYINAEGNYVNGGPPPFYNPRPNEWPIWVEDPGSQTDAILDHPSLWNVHVVDNKLVLRSMLMGNKGGAGIDWFTSQWIIKQKPTKRIIINSAMFYNICP
jgi:hypothetical protein